MKLKLGIGFSVVYLLALAGVSAWMSSPANVRDYMLAPFVFSFGLIGLVVTWVAVLIGLAVTNAAKKLSGDGDDEQRPFLRGEYAENTLGSAAWEAQQQAIRQRRQQTQSKTSPDSTKE